MAVSEGIGGGEGGVDLDAGRVDALATIDHSEALAKLAPVIARAEAQAANIRAPRTLDAYAGEWRFFEAWCAEHAIPCLPVTPAALALYVAHLGQRRKPSGVNVAVAAVAWAHRQARLASPHREPVVKDQLEALRREKGTRPTRKAPLTVDLLRLVVDALPSTLAGLRDRAVLLLGFAGGFRRSELISLEVADLTFSDEGVSALLRRSKTDQHGAGMTKAIPFGMRASTCPVRALRAWLDGAGIVEGPVFIALDRRAHGQRLSDHAVAGIVKARAAAVGLELDLSGHSLRSGIATSAARAGKDVFEIMATTGHRKTDTVATYVREAKAFERNAARGLL